MKGQEKNSAGKLRDLARLRDSIVPPECRGFMMNYNMEKLKEMMMILIPMSLRKIRTIRFQVNVLLSITCGDVCDVIFL